MCIRDRRYGSVQIRNVATIAGNIATASPIGDNLPLLLALDSQIVLQGIKKSKILPINDFFINYRKTKLKEGQFIHSIRIPILIKIFLKLIKYPNVLMTIYHQFVLLLI